MANRAPSRKKLVEAFSKYGIWSLQADLIRDMIHGEITTKQILEAEGFKKTTDWVKRCHNMPSRDEIVMSAIDDLLGGHGIVPLWGKSVVTPKYVYINMGDTYATTIIQNVENGSYFLGSWGDIAEYDKDLR